MSLRMPNNDIRDLERSARQMTKGDPDYTSEHLVALFSRGGINKDNKVLLNFHDAKTPGDLLLQVGGASTGDTTYGDNRLVFGQEYLHSALAKIIAGSNWKLALVGDSNTEWTGSNRFSTIFSELVSGAFAGKVSITNHGLGGATAYQWSTDTAANSIANLATQLATSPDLWFIRFGGTNDGLYTPFTAAGPRFLTALDQGCARIRSTQGGPEVTTIVLCTSPAANNQTSNTAWNQAINAGIRAIARKYKCVLIDLYGMMTDPDGPWIPDGFHPGETWNRSAAELVFNNIFPSSLIIKYGKTVLGHLVLNGNIDFPASGYLLFQGEGIFAATGDIRLRTGYPNATGRVLTEGNQVYGNTKGPVVMSPNGHYWQITVNDAGVVGTTDLGTSYL